ncbi:IbpA Molecular chaperone (small heat shock protein) [uncultured Caudovirales phage]|uniref:IbpA Molecular chaperone (Small heat shock protein) n=1 Tax=uncultured Caudovirales phage TaxID=2100421 RepID=A0A6J7WRH4_9CAUD|nr:IbpA Molecular chaperone (small heat shock protein) [uncultured Caudovirales phage]
MTTLDIPSLTRTLVGFDRLFELANGNRNTAQLTTYPPHNIIKIDDANFEIELAMAGFNKNEIKVEFNDGQLTVAGKKEHDESKTYIYKGLATRSFVKTIGLADYIEIKSAELKDGILTVRLERIIPDALKPKIIEIK